MGGDTPKQYLPVRGRPVIAHSIERLSSHPQIEAVVVAVRSDDPWWPKMALGAGVPIWRADGGAQRCDSVLGALESLSERADREDWVLVHDAVRPCLRRGDLLRLVERTAGHPVGGILGIPVRDTIKRAGDDGLIADTVNREGLWHAQTPQMFRLGPLREALRRAEADAVVVTDEAQAMERLAERPLMVEGHPDNIKITRQEDLRLAELLLAEQEHNP